MLIKLFFNAAIIAIIFQISACASTAPASLAKKNTTPQAKEDDRGFDPCLLNAKLTVCRENENNNRK